MSLAEQVWLAHGDMPMTQRSQARAAGGELSAITDDAPLGHVVLTQTCDLVPRSDRYRPFVAVAPLVQLSEDETNRAKLRRLPRFVHVPGYEDGLYCADLDRLTTVETGVLLQSHRSPGLDSDEQRLDFSRAVARKFNRFAFPDDLARSIAKWRKNVVTKHDKEGSPEGQLFRNVVDVLAKAHPSWKSESIEVTITVLFNRGFLPPTGVAAGPEVGEVAKISRLEAADVAELLCGEIGDAGDGILLIDRLQNIWEERCNPTGFIKSISFQMVDVDEMPLGEYLTHAQLDLEFLSDA